MEPVFTYVGPDGDRTELTGAELGAEAARVADLLTTGCGLGPGDRAALLMPPHWRTAAVVLGTLAAGLTVTIHSGLSPAGGAADVVFVDRRRVDDWVTDVPTAPHRFAADLDRPARDQLADTPDDTGAFTAGPHGYVDLATALAGRSTTAPPVVVDGHGALTTDGTTYGEWEALAREIADRRGIRAGHVVRLDVDPYEHPVTWLLAPLLTGAAVEVRRIA